MLNFTYRRDKQLRALADRVSEKKGIAIVVQAGATRRVDSRWHQLAELVED